jgi:hypothetical protein
MQCYRSALDIDPNHVRVSPAPETLHLWTFRCCTDTFFIVFVLRGTSTVHCRQQVQTLVRMGTLLSDKAANSEGASHVLERANEAFARAVASAGDDDADTYYSYGTFLLKHQYGDRDSRTLAENFLRRSIDIDPAHVLALDELAHLLECNGHLAEAEELWGKDRFTWKGVAFVFFDLVFQFFVQTSFVRCVPLSLLHCPCCSTGIGREPDGSTVARGFCAIVGTGKVPVLHGGRSHDPCTRRATGSTVVGVAPRFEEICNVESHDVVPSQHGGRRWWWWWVVDVVDVADDGQWGGVLERQQRGGHSYEARPVVLEGVSATVQTGQSAAVLIEMREGGEGREETR